MEGSDNDDGEPLRVSVTAPLFCVASEGTTRGKTLPDQRVVVSRENVGRVPVDWFVSGGSGGVYQVIAEDSTGYGITTGYGVSGRLWVDCAKPNINLGNVSDFVEVVEAGPKTIPIVVRDATGRTASTSVVVEIIEEIWGSKGLGPGTYSLWPSGLGEYPGEGTGLFFDIPSGLDLKLIAVSNRDGALLRDGATGTGAEINWATGEVLYQGPLDGFGFQTDKLTTPETDRLWDTLTASIRNTPHP